MTSKRNTNAEPRLKWAKYRLRLLEAEFFARFQNENSGLSGWRARAKSGECVLRGRSPVGDRPLKISSIPDTEIK